MRNRIFTLCMVLMAAASCFAQQKFTEVFGKIRYKFEVLNGNEVALVGMKGTKRFELVDCNLPTVIKHKGVEYTIVEIGDKMFKEAYHMKYVTLPRHLRRIGKYAFTKCIRLKSVEFPNTVEVIDKKAFFGTPLEDVFLPDAIKTVGKEAFCAHSANHAWISVMKHLDVPETCETIGKHAFSSYKNGLSDCRLTDTEVLSLPEWVTFENCESLGLDKKCLKRMGRVEPEPEVVEETEEPKAEKKSKKSKKSKKKSKEEKTEKVEETEAVEPAP